MIRAINMHNIIFIGIMTAVLTAACGAEPFIEKTNIFEAEVGGYAHYRIPGIVITPTGTILAYCEARKDTKGDWGKIDIVLRRSTDAGQSWDAAQKITTPPTDMDSTDVTLNNPVAIVDEQTGTIHFLYCVNYSRCFYMQSTDEGLTFSTPVEITATFDALRPVYNWKVLATGPGHGIQLDSGRLLVPVWLANGADERAHRPSCITSIYSDDHGKTWQAGEIIADNSELIKNPSETVAVQLTDGRVMFNSRSETAVHRRAVTFSPDGATNWTPPIFDKALYEPICMGSIVRQSTEPSPIIFANPDSRHLSIPDKPSRARENLSIKMSRDEGQTWEVNKVLEKGISGYSDLAVGPDGMIYCFYERGTQTGSHYNPKYLCVAKFNRPWLETKSD